MVTDLKIIKDNIEKLDKPYHIQIAQLLRQHNVRIDENKNGLFINLSELNENIIDILGKYLEYINNQMEMIDNIECKKQEYKDNFFNTNSSKDNTTYNES